MKFQQPLIMGRLIRRYQRFLADIDVEGEIITVHCPNPGALLGLNMPDATVWLSKSPNPKRRLSHTLEMIETACAQFGTFPVGINTGLPNRLVEEAIINGTIVELQGYGIIRREVRYGRNSRIDLLLEAPDRPSCYVEVKNVHLSRTGALAEFPDCVTARGAKHLAELSDMVRAGHRAVMIYCVQRADCSQFRLADDIDPVYARAFASACAAGVETYVYGCHISPQAIAIANRMKFASGAISKEASLAGAMA